MARKTKLQKLQEELDSTKVKLHNEQILHAETKGKLEHADDRLEEVDDRGKNEMMRVENYSRRLEDEVLWLRGLVEDMALPNDKFKMVLEERMKPQISGKEYHPEILNPSNRRY